MSDINAYQGNANLAQGTAGGQGPYGVYDFPQVRDTMDKLMAYQFQEKRDMWARANIEKDNAAKEAADALKFKLGDYLPADNKAILDKIGEYYKMYGDNPDVVKLTIDPATGKVSNGPEHAAFMQKYNEIQTMMAMANKRRSQADTVIDQVNKFADPTKRTQGQAYYNAQIDTPINQDIFLYPDLEVWNPKNLTVPDISFDQLTEKPNYLTNTTYKLADVGAGLDNFIIDLDNPTNQAMQETVAGFMNQYNGIIQKVRQEHPDLQDPTQFADYVKKEPGGENILQLYNNMNDYLQWYNSDGVRAYTKKAFIDPVNLMDGVNEKEMGLLLLTNKLTTDTSIKTTVTNDELQKYNIDKDYAAQMAGIAQRREEANKNYDLARENAGLKNNDALASDKLNFWMDVASTPFKPDAQQDKYGFKVPVDRMMEAIFEKKLPSPIKTKVPVDPLNPDAGYTEREVANYTISDVRITPDPSNDPNKSTVTVFYRDPSDIQGAADQKRGKVQTDLTQSYSLQRFWNLANNIYGPTNAEKVSKASASFLQQKFNSLQPDFQKLANNFAQSQASVTPQNIVELQGNIDASTLKSGVIYQVGGKQYTWNGKNLIAYKP